ANYVGARRGIGRKDIEMPSVEEELAESNLLRAARERRVGGCKTSCPRRRRHGAISIPSAWCAGSARDSGTSSSSSACFGRSETNGSHGVCSRSNAERIGPARQRA